MPSNVRFRPYTEAELAQAHTPEHEATYASMLAVGAYVKAQCSACQDSRHEDCDGLIHYERGRDQPPKAGYGFNWPFDPVCRCVTDEIHAAGR